MVIRLRRIGRYAESRTQRICGTLSSKALSLRITELFGLGFSAVDYMVDDTGTAHILEINTMPGLKWFHAPTAGPVVDVADAFMRAFVEVYEQHPDFVRR